jgi:hypothetical protein
MTLSFGMDYRNYVSEFDQLQRSQSLKKAPLKARLLKQVAKQVS